MENTADTINSLEIRERFDFIRIAKDNESSWLKVYQDPTYLGFKIFFKGLNNSITSPTTSGLFGSVDNKNSALYFLKQRGDTKRYNMLQDFLYLLSEINSNHPWYFQSIEGLDEAWNRDLTKVETKELTIQCLETIDLRITLLMDLYRKICFDWQNRREILPDNLRYFDMDIRVFDIRNIQKVVGYVQNESSNFASNQNTNFLGNDITDKTQVHFCFTFCQFDINSGNIFAEVSNNPETPVYSSMQINYEKVYEDNIFRLLYSISKEKSNTAYTVSDFFNQELKAIATIGTVQGFSGSDEPNFDISDPKKKSTRDKINAIANSAKDKAKSAIKDNINTLSPQNFIDNLGNVAKGIVLNKLNSLYLGNIYTGSVANVVNTTANKILQAPGNILKEAGDEINISGVKKVVNNSAKSIDNIFDKI